MEPTPIEPEQAVLHQLLDIAEVEQVWLFGSRARGDAAPRADIDIVIAIAAPAATPERWHLILARIDDAPTLLPIDVTRLEEASPALRDEILRTGRLHERRQSMIAAS